MEYMPNFYDANIAEAIDWAKQNNIEVEQQYEYSDNIAEYNVISQNINITTPLEDITKITFTVSSGPNYDKLVIVDNMVNWNIDDVVKKIKENHLNNVGIKYVSNLEVAKDSVISQSFKGQMKRNDKITFTVSLGNKSKLTAIEMITLTNQSLFEAELWLKRNGLNYKIINEFSDNTKIGFVIKTNIEAGTTVIPNDKEIIVSISKGKQITVPNLISMTSEEVTKWILDNNLKIEYNDKYDAKIPLGQIISVNYKEGDKIESGTVISITVSKGKLKMPKFNNLTEFRSWAKNYGINYVEEYQYNDTYSKGSIIKFSHNTDDTITSSDVITVYISNGKPVTIPNFVGKSKSSITSSCNSLGLNCSFISGSYSSISKDVATSQNKRAGSTVISGTYITLTLSKGPAKTYNIYIQPTWFGSTANATISTLKSKLSAACPGVTFTYVKKASNTGNSGMIHPDLKVKGGNNSFTQGKTYTITVINN